MAFTTPADVANRALQHLGVPRIASLTTELTKQAKEANFLIDKVRIAELQRVVWTFAVRRAVLRAASLSNTNTINFLAYNAATTYAAGDVVVDANSYPYISVSNANIGVTPGAGGVNPVWWSYFGPRIAQAWDTTVAYLPGDMIYTGAVVYICVLAHTGQAQPNATYWHVVLGATMTGGVVAVAYTPIGYKPDGSALRKIHRLPANFLRLAAQDPKAPAAAQLNVTAAMRYHDWEIESGFMFTNDADPIILRFVADQTDVATMDSIFCEVWAARMAIELCETLTQSAEKLNNSIGLYNRYTRIARTINAIEGGSSEAEPDDVPAPAAGGR